jgi:hypothetical protein
MWMYPGLSCPNRSFSAELDDVEINTQIRGILVHEANQNHLPMQFYDLELHLGYAHSAPWGSPCLRM